jgi:hypothetical protein
LKNPVAPFDPEEVEQPMNQFNGRSGVMVKNTPLYSKKKLTMTLVNIQAADYTTLQALYTKSFLKALPFLYWFAPTTNPQGTYLYNWMQDGFAMQYQRDGTHRQCNIEALADWSPDRSSVLL